MDIKKYCITINPCLSARLQSLAGSSYKDYGVCTLSEQRDQLKHYVRKCLNRSEISHMDMTFEITKKGNYHVHGIINCTFEQISDFRKNIFLFLGHPSGRTKYIDICCTVKEEFTDDGKWKEYMTKVSKNIHRILGKNYKYVDNHLQGIEDVYMVD